SPGPLDDARSAACAWSCGLRPLWAVGASARPKCAAKAGQLERFERRPVQAVDPADRGAEAAVLPRFPAEISLTPRQCLPSPIATAFFTPRTSLWQRSRKPSGHPSIAIQAPRLPAV